MEPRLYELSMLLKNESEEKLKEAFEKARAYIEEKNGRMLEEPHFTKKHFAYPIGPARRQGGNESEGFFASLKFFLKPEEILGLKEILGHEKIILRHLLVKVSPAESKPRPLIRKARRPLEKKTADLAEIDKKLEEILGK